MAVKSEVKQCRFYANEFPEVEDFVMVQVKRIADMGAYVSLLEYNNIEGMLLHSELSKRRIRSISKLVRVGQTLVCLVLRVDQDKGYIDLSKRRVSPEDAALKEETFAKAKAVNSIMRHVAQVNEIADVVDLCTQVAWPLAEKHGNVYEAFKKHVNGEIDVFADLDEISDKIKESIEIDLRRKLVTSMLRLRAKVEVSCFGYEGIDAVQVALLEGMKESKEDLEIKIKLIAHPLFALVCTCRDKEKGLAVINQAMKVISEKITEFQGGDFVVKSRPELVGADEKDDVKEDEDEDEDGSGSGSSEDQDETMGGANFDEEEMKKTMKVEDGPDPDSD